MVFIKPDGHKFEPAAMFPELTIAKVWLRDNYQGDNVILKMNLSAGEYSDPNLNLTDETDAVGEVPI